MKIKPKYRIELSNTAWFKYYKLPNQTLRGVWDSFTPNRKLNLNNDISAIPKDFYIEIENEIKRNRQREDWGRKLKAITCSVYNAGIICGWEPRIETHKQGDIVLWDAENQKGRIRSVIGFAILHCRWMTVPKSTNHILKSKTFLRFVVDNGGKIIIRGLEKKEL